MPRKVATIHLEKTKVKRRGVHAKSKSSKNKSSINYVKKYNRQGR
tara:strand:- start:246 stop:380 length:135 start_codon:yes stop_codon:yes gene_type:complete